MNIAYINKTSTFSNMPSTVFSTLNTYAFAQNGHEATVVFRRPKKTPDTNFEKYFDLPMLDNFRMIDESNSFLFLKSNEMFYARVNRRLIAEHQKKKFDLIITRDPGCLPYLVSLKKRLGCKVFYQSHNFYLDTSFQPDQTKINQKKFHKFEKQFIPKLDGLLAINNPQKELYEKYVDIPVFAGHPGMKKVFDFNDNFDKKIVFYSGSFQLKKGIDILIKAFAALKGKDAKLILAGGRGENELRPVRKLVESLGLNDRVTITGWLSYSELEKYLSQATVGVIPLRDSFYNQYLTAPSKLFDYLAFGIPVVASDLPSIRDFIGTNNCGQFIKPDDEAEMTVAINKIMSVRSLYQGTQIAIRKAADHFVWKNCAARMIDFMESV